MANRLLIIIFIITLTLGYAVIQSLVLDKKLATELVLEKNSILTKLPNASYRPLNESQDLSLIDLSKSHNLVVHFWATWCGPCEREFPDLLKLTEELKNKKDLIFLFISVSDSENEIKKFLKKHIKDFSNFKILVDSSNSSKKLFGTYKLPETYVFAKGGDLIKKFSGPQKWQTSYYLNFLNTLK